MKFPLPNYGHLSVYKQFSGIGLEQTRLCPNHCVFCAKASEGHENVSMSLDDLAYALELLPDFSGWVSLSGSGDALALKDLPERIALIKKKWPRCRPEVTTTLNIWHGKDYVHDLFSAGLETMVLSCYGHTPEDYAKVHGSSRFSGLLQNIEAIDSLPKKMAAKVIFRYFHNAHTALKLSAVDEKREQFVVLLRKVGITRMAPIHCFPWQTTRPVNGQALWKLPSPCDVVWGGKAGELIVLWNLDVVPCCMMYDQSFVLGNLRRMSLAEISAGEKYKFFYESWWRMRPGHIPVCNTCQLYQSYAGRDELARMAAWQARDLRGQKVVFWGAGEAYRAYKSFFADCEPVAMLVDSAQKEKIDGIPIFHPADFLPSLTEPLPLVIFAMQEASPTILQSLKEKYSFYKPSQLIICPANARIQEPAESFSWSEQ